MPWNCRWYGFPALTDALAPGGKRPCAEAWDLYDACMGGGFADPIAGSGAGPAPDVAARPGVNYNDPRILDQIKFDQSASDAAKWLETINANRGIMTGAPSNEGGLNLIWILAAVLVIAGVVMFKR